ncbi:MAG: methyltransferase domain-containing protein [Alphaproteobacteria bacterium]
MLWPVAGDLEHFYDSPEGWLARRLILRAVRKLWPSSLPSLPPLRGNFLGFGHTAPWLSVLSQDADAVLSFTPWRSPCEVGSAFCAVVDEDALPLASGSVSRIFMVHLFEYVPDVSAALEEIWRVLEDGGEVMCVVAARGGAWSRREDSPFGFGRPYSRRQLTGLLRGHGLEVVSVEGALFVPPGRSWLGVSAIAWERLGRRWFSQHAGVHVVLARKTLLSAQAVGARRRLKFAPTATPTAAATP